MLSISKGNKCSLWQESECSESGKIEGKLFIPRGKLFFPRSDGCLTERSEVRQSRSRKRKNSLEEKKEPESFFISEYNFFSPARMHFFFSEIGQLSNRA